MIKVVCPVMVDVIGAHCLCEYVCTCTLLFSGDDDGGASSLPILLQRHIQTEQVLSILGRGKKGQLAITCLIKCHSLLPHNDSTEHVLHQDLELVSLRYSQ